MPGGTRLPMTSPRAHRRPECSARRPPLRCRPTPARPGSGRTSWWSTAARSGSRSSSSAPRARASPSWPGRSSDPRAFTSRWGSAGCCRSCACLRAQPAPGPRPGGGGGDRAARRVRPGLAGQPALLPGMLRAVPGGGRGRGHRAVRGRPGHQPLRRRQPRPALLRRVADRCLPRRPAGADHPRRPGRGGGDDLGRRRPGLVPPRFRGRWTPSPAHPVLGLETQADRAEWPSLSVA